MKIFQYFALEKAHINVNVSDMKKLDLSLKVIDLFGTETEKNPGPQNGFLPGFVSLLVILLVFLCLWWPATLPKSLPAGELWKALQLSKWTRKQSACQFSFEEKMTWN